MKLRVIDIDETPVKCSRRVVLEHERGGVCPWVRDEEENLFYLWSNSVGHVSDRVYDPKTGRRFEVDSPFEEVLDDKGNETGLWKPRSGLIVIPVDIYEHGGIVWFLRGEAPVGCACPWDSTCNNREAPFYFYTDAERWQKLGPATPWTFKDGEPSAELMKKAREMARAEIKAMNLCESDSYYCWREEEKMIHDSEVCPASGSGRVEHRVESLWEDVDSVGMILTDNPAGEVDYPVGCPVVSPEQYLVGDTFEQTCWAFVNEKGRFMRFCHDTLCSTDNTVYSMDDPAEADLFGSTDFMERNLKSYERQAGCALKIVDVTERVWARYPMCIVK